MTLLTCGCVAGWGMVDVLDTGCVVEWSDSSPLDTSCAAEWEKTTALDSGCSADWERVSPLDLGCSSDWEKTTPLDSGCSTDWEKTTPQDIGCATGWDKTTPRDLGCVTGWAKTTPRDLGCVTGWAKMTPRDLGCVTGWAELFPRDIGCSIDWIQAIPIDRDCGFPYQVDQEENDLVIVGNGGGGCVIPWLAARSFIVIEQDVTMIRVSDSQPIKLINLSLQTDINSFYWKISGTCASRVDANYIRPTAGSVEVQVVINGYTWRFLIETLNETYAYQPGGTYSFTGVSPSIILGKPYDAPQTRIYTSIIQAEQIIADELSGTGWDKYSWASTFVTGWSVPANVFSVSNATKMDIFSKVIKGTGGVVNTFDGFPSPDPYEKRLIFHYRYPTSPKNWSGATPDATIIDGILSQSLAFKSNPKYNHVYVAGDDQTEGVLVQVRRTGEPENKAGNTIVNTMALTNAVATEIGRNFLDEYGYDQIIYSIDLPLPDPSDGNPPLLRPCDLVEIQDLFETWRGQVVGVKVDVKRPGVTQTIEVERHITDIVAIPVILPGSGSITTTTDITITCSTTGASIYYTTDGSEPTESSTLYSAAFNLGAGSFTVKAKAYKTGYVASEIAENNYLVTTPVPLKWDVYDKHPEITLSSGDLIATKDSGGSANRTVRAIGSITSGKRYFEVRKNVASSDLVVGVCNENVGVVDYLSVGPDAIGRRGAGYIWNGSLSVSGTTTGGWGTAYTSANDVVGVAVDGDADKVWFSLNGVWQASGDPVAGTNQAALFAGEKFPAISIYNNDNTKLYEAFFTSGTWIYGAPSGYTEISAIGTPTTTQQLSKEHESTGLITLDAWNIAFWHSGGSTWRSRRGITPQTTGKRYFEVKGITMSTGYNMHAGVGNATMSMTNYLAATTNGWCCAPGSTADFYKGYNGSFIKLGDITQFSAGDTMRIAVDIDAGKVWFGCNDTWYGDPGAGTGEAYSGLSATLYPMISCYYLNDVGEAYFQEVHWDYSAPTGFGEW